MKLLIKDINRVLDEEIEFVKKVYPKRYFYAYSFKNEKDVLRSLASGILLDRATRGYDEENYLKNEQGKPFIKNSIAFNLSHSEDYAVIAYEDEMKEEHLKIGVDIEKITNKLTTIIPRILSKNERIVCDIEGVVCEEDPEFCAKIWTLKEAYVKCIGSGINRMPDSIDIASLLNDLPKEEENETFYAKVFLFHDYVISVVSNQPMNDFRPILLNL